MNLKKITLVLVLVLTLVACGGAEERKQDYLQRGQALLEQKNFEKAQIEFKNVLQIDPKSADGWYYLGRVQEVQGKVREALGSYNSALEHNPEYHAAKIASARIYLFAGVTDKAMELIQQVLVKLPDDADALVVYASGLLRKGQADLAQQTALSVLEKNPDHLSALALMSGIYLDKQQHEKAEALLLAALQRKDEEELRGLLVQMYTDSKQMEAAIPHLQHFIKSHPDNFDYRNRLALFHDAIGQTAQAEEVLHAAVTALPDNMAAKVSLIQFLAQKRDAMIAHIELNKFIHDDPDNADLKLLSAQLYLQNNDVPAAEKIWRDIMVTYDKELPAAQARIEMIRMMLRDSKRMPEVKAELATLMKDNPTFNDGLLLRGNLSLNEGHYEEAINDFRAVLKDQPASVPVIKALATALISSGKPELAEEQLKMALSLTPRDPQVHMQLAQIFQSQKNYSDAAMHLQLAQKLDPESLSVNELLFRNYLAQKDYDSASKLADNIINKNAESPAGYFLKGMLLQAQGDDRGSIIYLERALSINPLATEPLNLLTRAALSTDQVPLITGKLQTIIKQHPEHFVARNLLGEIALQQKQYVEAEKIFSDLTQSKPAWWLGWRNLAQSWLLRNQPEQAVEVYRRGVSASGDERLVISLALLYEQLKRVDEAIALYDEALKRTPDSASFRNNLALLLAENRQDAASKDRALQLVKSFENSKNANDLDTLGWVRYQRGEFDMAIDVLQKAIKLAPQQLVTQYHLALAYYGKGKHDEARNYLQAVIKAEPEFGKRPDVARIMESLSMS